MQKHVLSKSTFIRGLKCSKSLYLNKHNRDLKDELSEMQKAIFNQGDMVGELAQQLFPNGIDCTTKTFYNFEDAIKKTQLCIHGGKKVIYEAAFQFNGVLAILDILVKNENGWKAYEVKSSTSISKTHINDAAIQSYVIENSGLKLEDVFIVHINNKYVKKNELDLEKLFTVTSVKDEISKIEMDISKEIENQKKILNQKDIPPKDIGPHCTSPYNCDFIGNCWENIPKYSVFDISNLSQEKKFDLFKKGILKIDDIPTDYPLSKNQKIQVSCEQSNEKIINEIKISNFISELQLPLYYLDFETFSSAVPIFNNSKPYEHMVFQFSLHIQKERNGKTTHYEHLAVADGSDPRLNFIKNLIKSCRGSGDIIVYNKSFESSKIKQLAEAFPEYEIELKQLISRIKDLMVPFQKKWYYKKEMKGSYSIKNVLPAMINNLSYESLTIKEGGMASHTFSQMMSGTFKGNNQNARKDLLEYCKLDTLAMVEILNKLTLEVKCI
ncbi:MAG: DUF2779 domain-containing protein [Flavobacteriales bacterium]|nr:DUF2779 domain-containing protein [Flavobacteriales bacterium]